MHGATFPTAVQACPGVTRTPSLAAGSDDRNPASTLTPPLGPDVAIADAEASL